MSDSSLSPKSDTTDTSGEADSDAIPVPTRSKIWMPYGDIILQAEFTQFRVNRDVLAQQSPVFKDMFSVPQPQNEPTVEGCPVVHVSDTAKDWELLLGVLYDPFPSIDKAKLPFPVVACMLRLGRKYEMQKAKDDAVARIRSEFPAELQEWQATPNTLVYIEAGAAVYVDMLNLCFECGILPSIPSLALACLSGNKLETLFTGVKRNDGSFVILSDTIKLILALAVERLIIFQHESLAWLEDEAVVPHTSCLSRSRCSQQRLALNHTVAWGEKRMIDLSYVIDVWDSRWTGKLCQVCESAARASYNASREKGWELLPTFFGLPEWKNLKDMD
ncbi:hypothetical protein B0H11DRAFT_1890584 [Mycena galericulata]|nr:hypothetical protein B0H11DRAFT_1890584 [Mycena galericulata]